MSLFLLVDPESEAIAVEPFLLVDLRFAVDLKLEIVLTVVHLRPLIDTLAYYGPISAVRICRRHSSLLL